MPLRYLLPLSWFPIVLAGVALSGFAQTHGPAAEQARTARDNLMVESTFAHADVDNDGKLSRSEAASLPAVYAKFDELDADKDGVLSLEEFAAAFTAASAPPTR